MKQAMDDVGHPLEIAAYIESIGGPQRIDQVLKRIRDLRFALLGQDEEGRRSLDFPGDSVPRCLDSLRALEREIQKWQANIETVLGALREEGGL